MNLKTLCKSIKVFIHLTKMGFFFSDNTHKDAEFWGFYRLNFDNGKEKKFAIIDFDFAETLTGKTKFISATSQDKQRIVN